MSEKAAVYLETTIPSFLTAHPSGINFAVSEAGYLLPTICTPDELFGGEEDER